MAITVIFISTASFYVLFRIILSSVNYFMRISTFMPRGRPRKYREDEALASAMQVFWKKGLAAASLDDLSLAMNMNRPSIYNAFGNKDALYRKSLAAFRAELERTLEKTLDGSEKVQAELESFFYQAISVYCGNDPALGCFMVCTAPSEAISHPEVGKDLKELTEKIDKSFEGRLRLAQGKGEVSSDLDIALTAKLLQATLQTLAIRARAGATAVTLRRLAKYSVVTLLAT
ncbi:MAG: TetR/AcrR family transcriptional regulator [Halieaceae bacterium]